MNKQIKQNLRTEKEYYIWGIKENRKDEQILYSKCKNKKEGLKVIKILENKYNCSNCRIQIINLNKSFNFIKEVLK